jgi:hypothetical protein
MLTVNWNAAVRQGCMPQNHPAVALLGWNSNKLDVSIHYIDIMGSAELDY